MKMVKAYLFGELSLEARGTVESGAYLYAAGMLLQQNNCPPHMIPKMHQTFLDEYHGGMFDSSGQTRFPSGVFKEPKDVVVNGTEAPVEKFPSP